MPNQFEIGPRYFIPFDKLSYSPQSPKRIIDETHVLLSLAREYVTDENVGLLLSSPIDLISLMEQGLFQELTGIHNFAPDYLQEVLSRTEALKRELPLQGKEAFGHAKTIFIHIPSMVRRNLFGAYVDASRRGRFTPPSTTLDFLDRFGELREGLIDTASGRNTNAREYAEVFFRVGAALPIHD